MCTRGEEGFGANVCNASVQYWGMGGSRRPPHQVDQAGAEIVSAIFEGNSVS
jgi:hypothetical protein